jgi:hypothetical protein
LAQSQLNPGVYLLMLLMQLQPKMLANYQLHVTALPGYC